MQLFDLLSFSAFVNYLKRAFGYRKKPKIENLVVTCSTDEPVHFVSTHYLSFSIDISVLAGGFWWEGSKKIRAGLGILRIPPLDLRSKKFNRLTAGLAPAYLRIGGSEADKIHYLDIPPNEKDALVLTQNMWDNLHSFLQQHNLKLYFTVKYGLFNQSQHGDWQCNEVTKLLNYSKEKNYTIHVCELGNELNAYWIFYGLKAQPKAIKLAKDYLRFSAVMRSYFPSIKVAGPGSAFWPKLGETIKPLSNITERFLQSLETQLDIVDWHYYPFQSTRTPVRTRTATLKNFLSPFSFEDFAKFSEKLNGWRKLYQPAAQLWTGETGSAQCGGEVKLSDRFVSCFWWADQLGRGAQLGQSVMIRQSLIGGEYGLIDRLTLKPRPDYWLSWLWKRLMGEAVYTTHSSSRRIRAYLHKHPDNLHFTLMLINVTSQEQRASFVGLGCISQQYTLSANRLRSRKVYINGIRPKIKNPNLSLESFTQTSFTNLLPPFSIKFLICSG